MKNVGMLKIVSAVLFFLMAAGYLYAECYNEDVCFKDYITLEDNNIVLAVNRETNDVELYWSDKDQTWVKPDVEYQKKLQKKYAQKVQLRKMQALMNRMHDATWFTRDNASGSGGRP